MIQHRHNENSRFGYAKHSKYNSKIGSPSRQRKSAVVSPAFSHVKGEPSCSSTKAAVHIPASDIEALAHRAITVVERSSRDTVYISVVGCPGSGKSFLSSRVCETINRIMGDNFSTVLPMDGYHIPASTLKEMAQSGKIIGDPDSTSGRSTSFEDLIKRRGAPWTYDAKKFVADITSAKAEGEGSFPFYCRKIGDPVPDQIKVTKLHRIVLCEGIYLNAFEDPEWKLLQEIWDDKWYLDIPHQVLKERLVNRHLENWCPLKVQLFGEGREGAAKKAESNDMKNARWVDRTSRAHADLFITFDG